jgi:hypothetical protein
MSKRLLATVLLMIPGIALAAGSEERVVTSVDPKCMQRAVEDRENSLIVAANTYNDSLMHALKRRKEDVLEAWALAEADRREELRKAWSTFQKSLSKARQTKGGSVRETWKQFDRRRAFCGQKASQAEETGNMQSDLMW